MNPNQTATMKISEREIAERVTRLGKEITTIYSGQEIVFVCILKGAFPFMADLVRACHNADITSKIITEFMVVSSYNGGMESSGNIRVLLDLRTDIRNKHVIIVEDIVDTGLTMSYLLKLLLSREPASLEICTLLVKGAPKVGRNIGFFGFKVAPTDFVIGYGLDLNERYRELPYIAVVSEKNADDGEKHLSK